MQNLIPPQSEFLLYTTPDGEVRVDVYFKDETVWLTQKKMSELFGCSIDNISLHLKNIFKELELIENSVIEESSTTASDGKKYKTKFYNLDAIIAIGYRVNSNKATQFRIWATQRLKEYIIKGFVLDDKRLKNPDNPFGKDYFEELLERIREIRASERRFYQKITDIYATSIDYNPQSEATKEFFATVQNKLHWAITSMTAAEIIAERADSSHPYMGLTAWKNSPAGKILKSDIAIAKNYLNEKELDKLNRIVEMYLMYGELQAMDGAPMKMKDWRIKLDAFLQFNNLEILNNLGKVSQAVAQALAEKEYDKFRITQDQTFESDFDREVKKLLDNHQD